jgi:hypothetical protein
MVGTQDSLAWVTCKQPCSPAEAKPVRDVQPVFEGGTVPLGNQYLGKQYWRIFFNNVKQIPLRVYAAHQSWHGTVTQIGDS